MFLVMIIHPVEALEYFILVFRLDADTLIGYRYFDAVIVHDLTLNGYGTSLRRIFNGVADEIADQVNLKDVITKFAELKIEYIGKIVFCDFSVVDVTLFYF